jgi:hypothetical protein
MILSNAILYVFLYISYEFYITLWSSRKGYALSLAVTFKEKVEEENVSACKKNVERSF